MWPDQKKNGCDCVKMTQTCCCLSDCSSVLFSVAAQIERRTFAVSERPEISVSF